MNLEFIKEEIQKLLNAGEITMSDIIIMLSQIIKENDLC